MEGNPSKKIEEILRLIELKVEGGFSLVFFALSATRFMEDDLVLAIPFLILGLLGISFLTLTITKIQKIQT